MSTIFVLLLLLGTTLGATHVNISIAQQTVTNPGGVNYVDAKAPADLKGGPVDKNPDDASYSNDANEERSANLRSSAGSQDSNIHYVNEVAQSGSGFSSGGRSARVQLIGSNRPSFADDYNGRTLGYNSNLNQEQQRLSQLRQQNEQEKKNLEFERYVQRHHSGPTVETVYEAASSSQRVQQPSSSSSSSAAAAAALSSSSSSSMNVNSRQSQVNKFERQIALPANIAEGDRLMQNTATLQPKPVIEPSQENVQSTVTANSDVHQSSNINNYPEQKTVDQPNYNYNGVPQPHQQPDPNIQYPPSVDEPQPGYGGYSNSDQSGFYGGSQHSNSDFYPAQPSSYQPPVVTKTIQIAQPALKAKKFEVRHPAIQKEFYDIEERVLIKPAGTVVVELNHPVAKIPRGETILPLGHPHPAVANAYNNHNAQGTSQHQVSSSNSFGSSNSNSRANGSPYNTQYSPSPVFSPKPFRDSTSIGSSVISTPIFDHNARGAAVDANLNGEASFVPSVENKRIQEQQRPDDYFIATDAHGNQRQISTKNFSPSMFNEQEFRYPAQVDRRNNAAPGSGSSSFSQQQGTYSSTNNNNNNNNQANHFAYVNKERRTQPSPSPNQVESSYAGQLNFYNSNNDNNNNINNNDRDQFKAEYIEGPLNNRESFKPARLREPSAPKEPLTHIIKHEHNIHLPPTQHNIYLGRLEQIPATNTSQSSHQPEQKSAQLRSSRFEEETARVLEVKPYLQRDRGSVVVYASTTLRPFARYSEVEIQSDGGRARADQYRGQLRTASSDQLNRVQYSAPYSNMRHHPQQSARLTYDKLYAVENAEPSVGSFGYDRTSGYKANLEVESDREENSPDENSSSSKSHDDKAPALKTVSRQQNTHIQIQIPQLPEEADKPIVVSSTISPPLSEERSEKYRLSSTSSSSFAPSSPSSTQEYSGKYRLSSSSGLEPPLNQDRSENSRFGPFSNEERSDKYRLSFPSSFVPSSDQERSEKYRTSSFSTFVPSLSQERSGNYRSSSSSFGRTADVDRFDSSENSREQQYSDSARFGNLEAQTKPDCDETAQQSARYESGQVRQNQEQQQQQQRVQQPRSEQKFMRITESSEAGAAINAESSAAAQDASIKPSDIEISPNSVAGHVAQPAGSRIIAATAAPTDTSSHSESFHKRRIVVNHPFQTVREVVEHEPYTNYHQIQVNEPASPAHYRTPFLQTHGALRQVALASRQSAASTHGNLQYAAPARDVTASYNKRSI